MRLKRNTDSNKPDPSPFEVSYTATEDNWWRYTIIRKANNSFVCGGEVRSWKAAKKDAEMVRDRLERGLQ